MAAVDKESLEDQLKSWVASKTKIISHSDLTSEMSLFSSGLLDSILFIQLILFIEKICGIKLSPTTGANMTAMDSIGQIIQVIARAEEK